MAQKSRYLPTENSESEILIEIEQKWVVLGQKS